MYSPNSVKLKDFFVNTGAGASLVFLGNSLKIADGYFVYLRKNQKMSKKEFTNGEVTIVWKPGLCIHSAVCVKGLPDVFRPDEKPWIKVEEASTEHLIRQVERCPSGALSYFLNDSEAQATTAGHEKETLVEIRKNGPLMVHGKLHINYPDGGTENVEKTTAFCRCGHSARKPFCDGSHRNAGFEG